MNELVTQETGINAMQLPGGIAADDIEHGKLLLQQKTSDAVDQGKAKPGDIVDTITGLVVGGEGNPVMVIPLAVKKEWNRYYVEGQDRKWFETVAYSPANANWKFEEMTEDGKHVKNDLIMIWAVLPVINESVGMPSMIHFRGMSHRAGKKLATIVAQASFSGKQPYENMIQLGCHKETGDKTSYYVFDVSPAMKTPEVWLETAKNWSSMLLGR